MPHGSHLDRVASIVLRFMRKPLVVLVSVYAVSIIGMVLMPGEDAAGNPKRMSFFHAFYFMTYTATTTGFGELPVAFTNAQRLWAIFALYMSVVAWFYAIGSIIGLIQNPHFRQAVAERRFSRAVKRISEPFFIICGFGDTGSLLTRGISDAGYTAVIVDDDAERIKALSLRDYPVTMPGVQADASLPRVLINAGVRLPGCRAIIALTSDEDANAKIAVMARLLNPAARVICLSTSRENTDYLDTLPEVETVNPFTVFADHLGTALSAPRIYALNQWLIKAPGARLDQVPSVPLGDWILCGHGRMGRCLDEALRAHGIDTTVIDPALGEGGGDGRRHIVGRADAGNLRAAGIEAAAGIVAATNSDADNLGILLNAAAINPRIFRIVRQNDHENELAFHAARADLIMQPSLVTARRILFMLISPLISVVLDYYESRGRAFQEQLLHRLETVLQGRAPELWTLELEPRQTSAVHALLQQGVALSLRDLLRDSAAREQSLHCLALAHKRGRAVTVAPAESLSVALGDQLLLCGSAQAKRLLDGNLNNVYRLAYLASGRYQPRGYLARWLARWLAGQT